MGRAGLTSRSSMSRTAWLTWCRISRQHSAASSTFSRSAGSSVGEGGTSAGELQAWAPLVPGQGGRRESGPSRWAGPYLCSARCFAGAAGTWSAAASPWGSCPSAAGGGTAGGSRPPKGTAALRWPMLGPSLWVSAPAPPPWTMTQRHCPPPTPTPHSLPHLHEGTETRLLALLGLKLL